MGPGRVQYYFHHHLVSLFCSDKLDACLTMMQSLQYSSLYRNPVYHQVIFASLMFTVLFRTEYLMRLSPDDINRANGSQSRQNVLPKAMLKEIKTIFRVGCATFSAGFVIWNLDNLFCSCISRWKDAITWPLAFLLEGHAWWHVLTVSYKYMT